MVSRVGPLLNRFLEYWSDGVMEKPNAEPSGFQVLFSLKHMHYQPEANTPGNSPIVFLLFVNWEDLTFVSVSEVPS